MGDLGDGTGSSYPAALDTDTNQEVNSPSASKTKARAEVPNDLAAAVIAVQTELGTDPAGTVANVKTFLQTEHNTDGTHLAGHTVQVVHTQTSAVDTGTTILPIDDSIPVITEGDEYMTLAITPESASNKLVIETTLYLSHSTTDSTIGVALFQDTTANALAAALGAKEAVINTTGLVTLTYEMTSGTTSSTTFRIRAGFDSIGTTTFNGSAGARLFGGVINSFIRITEVKV